QRLDARECGFNTGLGDFQAFIDGCLPLEQVIMGAEHGAMGAEHGAQVLVDGVLMRRDPHQMPNDLVILLRFHGSSSYATGTAALRVRWRLGCGGVAIVSSPRARLSMRASVWCVI